MHRLLRGLLAATALLPAAATAQENSGERGRPSRGEMRATAGRAPMQRPPHQWTVGPNPQQMHSGQPRPDQARNDSDVQVRPRPGGNGGWNGQPRADGGVQGRPRPEGNGGSNGQPRPGGSPNWNRFRPGADRPDRVDERAWRQRQQAWRQWQRNDNDWGDHFRGDQDFAERSAWNRSWHSDHRYDWREYRASNRILYHMPRYYPPYGWDGGYRRFSSGVRLNSVLFAEDYWISEPWTYRLPPIDGPYRWVRYYNDALLIDLRYGLVVDVVHDIFW